MSKELWIDKYRPSTLDEYVFKDERQQQIVEGWVADKSIPNLMLTGSAGVGKTALAKLLLSSLDVNKGDIKIINGSLDNGVDFIRDKVQGFIEMMPYGEFSYILYDEFEFLSLNAQASLRNMIDTYSNTTRFILTANYTQKILPAIYSRCQGFHIERLDKNEFTLRVATILVTEGVTFDIEVLDMYVAATYPDMRKCINTIELNSLGGILCDPETTQTSNTEDYRVKMVSLFRSGKFIEARELICKQIRPDEYDDVFRFMYENLDIWAKTKDDEAEVIIAIRNGLAKAALCADQEINLAGTFSEIELIAKG